MNSNNIITVQYSNLDINNVSFVNNHDVQYIINSNNSTINVKNTIFSNNVDITHIIYCSSSTLSIQNSIFQYNSFNKKSIIANVLTLDSTNAVINNSTFTQNIGFTGACVYSYLSKKLIITNSIFNLNIGTYMMYLWGSNLVLSYSSITIDGQDPLSLNIKNIFYLYYTPTTITNTQVSVGNSSPTPYFSNFYVINCQSSNVAYNSAMWDIPNDIVFYCYQCGITYFNSNPENYGFFTCHNPSSSSSTTTSSSFSTSYSSSSYSTYSSSSYLTSSSTSYSTTSNLPSPSDRDLSPDQITLIWISLGILIIVVSFLTYKVRKYRIKKKIQQYCYESSHYCKLGNTSQEIPSL